MIQWMLAIWFVVPLPFLNSAYTSGSSGFMYYGSLVWRILSITSLACETSATVWWGGGSGKPLQHSCCGNPMESIKRKNGNCTLRLTWNAESYHWEFHWNKGRMWSIYMAQVQMFPLWNLEACRTVQGSPSSRIQCLMIWGKTDGITIEMKYTTNVMSLNCSQTISSSPWSVEILSSSKMVPGAKKVGDHCHGLLIPQISTEFYPTAFIYPKF